MKLELLLKPVKWMDEQILRQYTKIGKKWEDKGRNIKGLTIPLSLVSIGLYWAPIIPIIPGYGYYIGMDITRNLFEKKRDVTSGEIAIDNPMFVIYRKLHNATRFPLFATGVAMTTKGLIDICRGLAGKENLSPESLGSFCLGLSFLSTTSSIYLKDRDPKLLDKAPAFEKVYNWIKEKIQIEPVLQPAPVHSLEGYSLNQ